MALQGLATKRQADLTQHIFEASRRPYVTTEAHELTDAKTNGRLSFNLVFRNEGTVPTDITDFDVRGALMDLDGREQPVNPTEPIHTSLGRALAPHEMAMIQIEFSHPGLPNPPLPFQLLGTSSTVAVSSSTYRTEFDALRDAFDPRTQ